MSVSSPGSAYDHQELAAMRSDADGPSATDRSRAERAAKGWSVESVIGMAGDAHERIACALERIEDRDDHGVWFCRCGRSKAVVAGVELAYLDYVAHRKQTAYWRAHVLAILDDAAAQGST